MLTFPLQTALSLRFSKLEGTRRMPSQICAAVELCFKFDDCALDFEFQTRDLNHDVSLAKCSKAAALQQSPVTRANPNRGLLFWNIWNLSAGPMPDVPYKSRHNAQSKT